MPKGDREKLKADPQDGTTPIANLLLEALAITRLGGKEVRACLYLMRRTYGWQINGDRLKEAKIPFKEWKAILNSDAAHTSTLLAGLEQKNIIQRRYLGPKGQNRGYYYSMNTIVAEWSNSCLNKQLLQEMANIKLPKTATIKLPKKVTTLATNLAMRKERLNKIKESNEIYKDKNQNYLKKKYGYNPKEAKKPYQQGKKRVDSEDMETANRETISGQSMPHAIEIAQGKVMGVPDDKVKFMQTELDRRGIPWQKKKAKKAKVEANV